MPARCFRLTARLHCGSGCSEPGVRGLLRRAVQPPSCLGSSRSVPLPGDSRCQNASRGAIAVSNLACCAPVNVPPRSSMLARSSMNVWLHINETPRSSGLTSPDAASLRTVRPSDPLHHDGSISHPSPPHPSNDSLLSGDPDRQDAILRHLTPLGNGRFLLAHRPVHPRPNLASVHPVARSISSLGYPTRRRPLRAGRASPRPRHPRSPRTPSRKPALSLPKGPPRAARGSAGSPRPRSAA